MKMIQVPCLQDTRERTQFALSSHAEERMQEHHLSPTDVGTILTQGEWSRARGNRTLYYFPESPFLAWLDPRRTRLTGYVVVLAADETIVSVYRQDCRFRSGDLR